MPYCGRSRSLKPDMDNLNLLQQRHPTKKVCFLQPAVASWGSASDLKSVYNPELLARLMPRVAFDELGNAVLRTTADVQQYCQQIDQVMASLDTFAVQMHDSLLTFDLETPIGAVIPGPTYYLRQRDDPNYQPPPDENIQPEARHGDFYQPSAAQRRFLDPDQP